MSIIVDVQWASQALNLPTEDDIVVWVKAALASHQACAELSVRIVDSEEMAQLNHAYRKKAGVTNVLSFPFSAPIELDIPLLGDIVICAAVIEHEAAQQNKALASHWAHMVIHGVLHLLGYDHIESDEQKQMEQLEIAILSKLNIANPYLEDE